MHAYKYHTFRGLPYSILNVIFFLILMLWLKHSDLYWFLYLLVMSNLNVLIVFYCWSNRYYQTPLFLIPIIKNTHSSEIFELVLTGFINCFQNIRINFKWGLLDTTLHKKLEIKISVTRFDMFLFQDIMFVSHCYCVLWVITKNFNKTKA